MEMIVVIELGRCSWTQASHLAPVTTHVCSGGVVRGVTHVPGFSWIWPPFVKRQNCFFGKLPGTKPLGCAHPAKNDGIKMFHESDASSDDY